MTTDVTECAHCAGQVGNSKGCFCKTPCGIGHCAAPFPVPAPSLEPQALWRKIEPIRSEEETRYHHPHRILPDPFQAILSGPALHPTQIRALALMSAVTLYASNVASNNNLTPADRPRLESSILDSAARFEAYIRGAQ